MLIWGLICLFMQISFLSEAATPKVYAVVIGISNYQHDDLNLKYADRDAKAFADFLKSPNFGSTPDEQIALLLNKDATRSNVLFNIQNFSSLATADDVLIIYFAGHGTNATYNNNFFLITYDTDPDPRRISSTATSAEEIKGILNSAPAKMIFWITDACNSGKIETGGGRSRGAKVLPSGAALFLSKIAAEHSGGFVYLASSQSQEVTREGEQYGGGHGIFTYFLLEGLYGQADDDHNGIVTINECYDYVHDKVIHESGGYQHPVLGDLYFNGKFPMSSTGNLNILKNARKRFNLGLPPKPSIPPDKGDDKVTVAEESAAIKPAFEQTIKVNALLHTKIKIRIGEKVVISATGTINVGQWVGISGPEGKSGGVFGFPISNYNIVPNFRHALLMLKLQDADDWISCGANFEFTATKNGELIFQVNDNDQGNNQGAYEVTIQKYH